MRTIEEISLEAQKWAGPGWAEARTLIFEAYRLGIEAGCTGTDMRYDFFTWVQEGQRRGWVTLSPTLVPEPAQSVAPVESEGAARRPR